jgi:cell division protein FtsQ
MRVSAPADRRFRRAHVKPPRRRRPWTARGWLIARMAAMLAVLLYASYHGASLVLSAEALQITRITVSGNARLSKGEVAALLDGLRGLSMVTADLEGWRRKLMNSPWVADAALRRVLPGTIAVVILERQPMGIARLGTDLYLVDQRGTVVDQFGPNYAEFDLPIIDGLASAPRDGAPLIDDARAALAARLLATLQTRPDLAKWVSQVDVSDSRDAVVILKNDTVLVRLGEEAFVERLQSYLDLAPTLRERVDDIDYVDLRFDERIYVKGQKESGVRGQKGSGIRGQGSGRGQASGNRDQSRNRGQRSRGRRQRARGGE